MVVRISSGAKPTGAVYYNENKVEKGEAERLALRNYERVFRPVSELSMGVIVKQLEDRADLNTRISKPTFHASLSLAQGEKPTPEELVAIADRYMEGLGYGKQPYAIYQHFDTDHAHIHIVSVRVDEEGKKVPDAYERERSNKLRQQIEQDFGLQVAERTATKQERQQLQPVEYGQGDLKRDISQVVQGVLREFTFSSLAQFNLLLNVYNVRASEVAIEGKKPGLVYSAIDKDKNAVGANFKASSLPFQPTMDTVNRRINAGKKIKGDKAPRLRTRAKDVLDQSNGWGDFQQRLSKAGIEVIPHLSKDGNLFGISYVDVRQRGIYTGSELGKAFTAGSLKVTIGETYTAPSYREELPERDLRRSQQQKPDRQLEPTQGTQQDEPDKPVHNASLIRQMLYAIGQMDGSDENDQELKQMLKRSRKTR